jgi:hypothetical protein
VIRSETQEAYEVAMHSKLASDWELCDAAQEEQRDETTQAALFSRDADATASLWRKEHGSGSLAGSKAAARHAIRSMPANSAPVCESIRAADGTEVTESAELQRFREHYKQLVPHWCAPSSTRTTSTA